jgi:crotonobetainyl-CoA:carnitine CoA-transferase CaiB-like acyl-CoA transferase
VDYRAIEITQYTSRNTSVIMSDNPKPLDDIVVLDIATFVAGPFAATCLGEFGADVIKIEKPGVGDYLRQLGTQSEAGDTYWWFSDARNKKCITLDLKLEKGKEIFKRMVANADVVVENFRPGTLEKWGLGFDELLAINPKLVMLRVSAYGQEGPKNHLPGFARIAQAYAGLSYLTGQPDTPPLIAGSTTLADYLSGLYGAYGIMLALRAVEKTGRGQFIDVALHDGIFRFLDEIASVYSKTGHVRERQGTETHSSVPHSHYQCSDGHWVAIACTNDKMFERFAMVMGDPGLADNGRYALKAKRIEDRDIVNGLVRDFTMGHPRDEIIRLCSDGDVPCGKVSSIADIFEEEQFWVRDTLLKVPDERIGELAVQGVIPKLSDTPGEVKHLGVEMGKDTEAVLARLGGVSADELDALRGVI